MCTITKQMLATAGIHTATLIAMMFYGDLEAKAALLDMAKRRNVTATRVTAMPVIGGKLDDRCWKQSEPLTNFVVMNSAIQAEFKTLGYLCFDDTNLYIAVKCLMPSGVEPTLERGSAELSEQQHRLCLENPITLSDFKLCVAEPFN